MNSDDAASALAVAVRRAREARGWSQERLAREAGISREAIRRIEHGDRRMPTKLPDIATALGMQVEDLLAAEDGQQREVLFDREQRIRDLQRLAEQLRDGLDELSG
jgi:transcriptional regulator with XRE-family HTH domain